MNNIQDTHTKHTMNNTLSQTQHRRSLTNKTHSQHKKTLINIQNTLTDIQTRFSP